MWCKSRYRLSHPGQLSLAIPLWVGAMSANERWEVNRHAARYTSPVSWSRGTNRCLVEGYGNADQRRPISPCVSGRTTFLCLRHRWKTVPEAYCDRVCPSVTDVRECVTWVRESVSPNLWTPYLKNQWREFHPILVTDVLRFIDVLIRFWGQKVKGQGQGHSR